jgi:hypothetical protein
LVKWRRKQKQAVDVASLANTKYSKEEKVFQEYISIKRKQHGCDIDIAYLMTLWGDQKELIAMLRKPPLDDNKCLVIG